jgi:adenylate kinase family enzyme/Mg-chelatase subunit ChlD
MCASKNSQFQTVTRTRRYVWRNGYSDYEYDDNDVSVSVSSFSASAASVRNILDNANAARADAKADTIATATKHIPRALVVKLRVMVLGGRPGSGKGTQAKLWAERSGILTHFSSGDFFRDEIAKSTPLGLEVQQYLVQDMYVPDTITNGVIFEKIKAAKGKTLILDGFPRTPAQAAALNEAFNVVSYYFIHVPRVECQKRIAARMTDLETGESFSAAECLANGMTVPDEDDTSCHVEEEKKTRLVRRELDQDEENTLKRLDSHDKHIGHLMYAFKGKIKIIDGTGDKQDVADRIDAAYDAVSPQEQNVFCACKYRIANQLHMPCGHCFQCAVCAKPLTEAPVCTAPNCGKAIEDYITLERYTRNKRAAGPITEGEETAGINLKAELASEMKNERLTAAITIEVPDSTERIGQHIIPIVDISGSMSSTLAKDEDAEGKTINLGYNLLESVKMSLNAIVRCLTDRDRLSLVTFGSVANTLMEHVQMDAAGIAKATENIATMGNGGSTNLWAGLMMSLEIAKKYPGRVTLVLLSDGQPDDKTKGGKDLREWMGKNPFPFQLHTFAYGTGLHPGYLAELADMGRGTYNWLPTSGYVGSSFIKFMANACSVCTQSARLQLTVMNQASFVGNSQSTNPGTVTLKGINPCNVTQKGSNKLIVDLGALYFGQAIETVVTLKLPASLFKIHVNKNQTVMPYLKATVFGQDEILCSIDCDTLKISSDAKGAVARLDMVQQVRKAVNDPTQGSFHIEQAIATLEKMRDEHPAIPFYLKDLKGELVDEMKNEQPVMESGVKKQKLEGGKILKGAQLDKWGVWGQHYLPSFMTSHERKLCTNIFETSLIPYITELNAGFTLMGEAFYTGVPNSIPTAAAVALPQPSNQVTMHVVSTAPPSYPGIPSAPAPITKKVSNSGYGTAGTGSCFAGNCLTHVLKEEKEIVTKVEDLRVGDWVKSVNGYAKLKHVLRKTYATDLFDFEGGLRLSERHPYREIGTQKWLRPECESYVSKSVEEMVYNFVLESQHIILVNGKECLTLGHDFPDPTIQHPLYSSSILMEAAVKDLKRDIDGTITVGGTVINAENRVIGFWQ